VRHDIEPEVAQVADIFLSYRKDDSSYVTSTVHVALARRFGTGRVFLDWSSMQPGTIYPPAIRAALARSRVLVALVGRTWLLATDPHGRRRVDNSRDWVRMEIRYALRNQIPVVPVVLDGARLPAPDELPDDIRGLALCQITKLGSRSLDADIAKLCGHLERIVPELAATHPAQVTAADQAGNTGGWVQNNTSSGPGAMYVNQGSGGMTITFPAGPGPERNGR
jgi:TIR domain